jgi:hypothetical protein
VNQSIEAKPAATTPRVHVCPECGEDMTYQRATDSYDGDGVSFPMDKAGWACECGYQADE